MFRSLKTLSECKQAVSTLYMATVQDQEKSAKMKELAETDLKVNGATMTVPAHSMIPSVRPPRRRNYRKTRHDDIIDELTSSCDTYGLDKRAVGRQCTGLRHGKSTFDEGMSSSAAWAVRHRKSLRVQMRVPGQILAEMTEKCNHCSTR